MLSLRIKGDKPHEVPLNPFAFRCLREHIERLSEQGFDTNDPEQWLFPSLSPIQNKPLLKLQNSNRAYKHNDANDKANR